VRFFSDPPKSVSELVTYMYPLHCLLDPMFVPPMTCFLKHKGGQVGRGGRKGRGGCKGGRFWIFLIFWLFFGKKCFFWQILAFLAFLAFWKIALLEKFGKVWIFVTSTDIFSRSRNIGGTYRVQKSELHDSLYLT
jgi:hypothetical protein